MKATEVLNRYANRKRDFRGDDLRGQSFKGQDLSGADFTEADIRGANFTNAILKGVNFTGAKAGVQKRWMVVQLIITFLLLATMEVARVSYSAIFIAYFFNPNWTSDYGWIPSIMLVISNTASHFIIARQGLTTQAIGGSIVITAIAVAATGGIHGAGFGGTTGAASAVVAIGVAAAICGVVAIGIGFASIVAAAIVVAVATGVGVGVAIAVAIAIVVAVATSVGVAIAVPPTVPLTVAALIAVTSILLGLYASLRVSKEDEKFAQIRSFSIRFAAIGGTSFSGADLTKANFTRAILKSTNFDDTKQQETNLACVCWKNAKQLDLARVGNSILADAAVRDLLVTRNGYKRTYISADLRDADLEGVNFNQADLKWADLSNAILHHADLKDANLREVVANGTDFTAAYLTGACLETWSIDHTTKLDQVDCQYVFLLEYPNKLGSRERRPYHPDQVFAAGDFEKLYSKAMNLVQILLRDGINREAFFEAFQKLMEKHPDTSLDSIQAIGKNGSDALITLKVPETADKAKISQDFLNPYENRVRQLEAQVTELQTLRSTDLKDIALALAIKPTHVINQATAGDNAVNDNTDRSQNINISGSNVTGSTINLGAISGSVSNVVNQLPNAPDPAQPGIKELLIELQAAIESDADLPKKGKASALEHVKVLAEVAQDPEQPEKKSLGSQAITFLKGAASFLPDTAKLAEACTKLLPLITKALGLPF